MAILWSNKWGIHMLMNNHKVPADGNFCNVGRKVTKVQIVMDYNRHMGYVDKRSTIAKSYSISCVTLKWTKKLFFHLLDLAIPNS
jgi:hypothetical protein